MQELDIQFTLWLGDTILLDFKLRHALTVIV